ncbi:MAG: alpha/beta hydrolase [Chloroflexota bacterium]|nr:alpha/beta hydrolase [Chloroflexota bacterium]
MVHGRDGALQEFTFSFFGQVAERYDAIAFDRPGYGHSEWPQGEQLSLEIQARLINRALSQLQVEEPLLVGHSYGGAVVLQYLLDYPDGARGAVLLGPVAYMEEPPEGSLFAFPNIPVLGPLLTHTILMPVGSQVADGMYQQAFWADPAPDAYVDTMKALYLRPANFTATAGELAVMQESVQAISPRYGEIDVPVTILAGSSDQMVDVEENVQALAGALPDGELVLVEDTGHKLHHTHSDVVMDAVNQVVQKSAR